MLLLESGASGKKWEYNGGKNGGKNAVPREKNAKKCHSPLYGGSVRRACVRHSSSRKACTRLFLPAARALRNGSASCGITSRDAQGLQPIAHARYTSTTSSYRMFSTARDRVVIFCCRCCFVRGRWGCAIVQVVKIRAISVIGGADGSAPSAMKV